MSWTDGDPLWTDTSRKAAAAVFYTNFIGKKKSFFFQRFGAVD